MTGNKKELFDRLSKCKREVDALRTELNALNDKKESLFQNKEKISKEIIDLIKGIKSSKRKRDEITDWVKKAKDKRKELNDEIKKKVEKIKELNQKKRAMMQKYKIKEDPSNIKTEIEKMEFRIETEGLPYNQEQKLTAKIKEMRKKYKELQQISGVFEKSHTLSKEIDKIRQKADETHKRIQNKAKTSQEQHEGMIDSSKEIDDFRQKEKEAMTKFVEAKTKFQEVNENLQKKLLELNEIRVLAGEEKKAIHKVKENNKKRRVEDLQREVEEKIKRGEKLTTEDLIAMQGLK